MCIENEGPLTSWNGAVEHEEDCGHTHADGEIDQGGEGPGGCQGTENTRNGDNDENSNTSSRKKQISASTLSVFVCMLLLYSTLT